MVLKLEPLTLILAVLIAGGLFGGGFYAGYKSAPTEINNIDYITTTSTAGAFSTSASIIVQDGDGISRNYQINFSGISNVTVVTGTNGHYITNTNFIITNQES